jgi:hypothetical protein
VTPNVSLFPYTFRSYPFEQTDPLDYAAQADPAFIGTEIEIARLYLALAANDFAAIARYCCSPEHDYDPRRYTARQWGRTRALYALALTQQGQFAEALQELLLCRQHVMHHAIEPEGYIQLYMLLGAVADIEHQVGVSGFCYSGILDHLGQLEREQRMPAFTRGSPELLASNCQIALALTRFVRNAQRAPGDGMSFDYLSSAYHSLDAAMTPWRTWAHSFFRWPAALAPRDLLTRDLPPTFTQALTALPTISTTGPAILRIIMLGRQMFHAFSFWKVRLLGSEDDAAQMRDYQQTKIFADFYAKVALDDHAMLLSNYQHLIDVALEMARRTKAPDWISEARGNLMFIVQELQRNTPPITCDPRIFVLFKFELDFVELQRQHAVAACRPVIDELKAWLAMWHPHDYANVYLLGRGYLLLARLHHFRDPRDPEAHQWQQRALEAFHDEPYADPLWGWVALKAGV